MISVCGCELFNSTGQLGGQGLPPLQAAPDAIQLEVILVERPVGDRLIGDALWKDVNEILDIHPEAQHDLQRNGFRIGVIGSHPPEALETLLGLKSNFGGKQLKDDEKKVQGNRFFVRSGWTTEINVSRDLVPECELTQFASHKSEKGETKRYKLASFWYQMTATRDPSGWIRLDFVPEIRYGERQMRPDPADDRWELTARQRSERLHSLKFSMMLNIGDIAIVTGRDHLVGTVGYRFFLGPDGDDDHQRLLLVRFAHMGNESSQ